MVSSPSRPTLASTTFTSITLRFERNVAASSRTSSSPRPNAVSNRTVQRLPLTHVMYVRGSSLYSSASREHRAMTRSTFSRSRSTCPITVLAGCTRITPFFRVGLPRHPPIFCNRLSSLVSSSLVSCSSLTLNDNSPCWTLTSGSTFKGIYLLVSLQVHLRAGLLTSCVLLYTILNKLTNKIYFVLICL